MKNGWNANNFKAICSDLDHTLLMPDKSISPRTAESLARLMESGIEVVPCTGRSFHSLPDSVMNFPGIRYVIISNGAAIYDLRTGEPIRQVCLDPDFGQRLFDFLEREEEQVTYECFVRGQAYTSTAYFRNPADFGIPGEIEKNYVQSTRKPVSDIKDFILEKAGFLDALDVILPPRERNRVLRKIQSSFSDVYITASVPHLIEISHRDSGKHHAMKVLMDMLDIPLNKVMAFGDGDNDSEMLSMAGMGIAVSNGSEGCKKAADLVIGESRHEAMADFLIEYYHLDISSHNSNDTSA